MSPPRQSTTLFLAALLFTPALSIFLDAATYDDLSARLGELPALLLITVRWCDHCIALQPEVKALAAAARRSPAVLVARVDAEDEPAVATKLSVTGFPTILYVPSGHRLADGHDGIQEFVDFRWAELMAEFVNNETESELIAMQPRPAFLRWREKNPYNVGKKERSLHEEERPEEREGTHVLEEMTAIREPEHLVWEGFDRMVLANADMRFMVLFYSDDDPFLRDLLVQWRQASSAFTGADNVTIAIVNLSDKRNGQFVQKFDIEETPRCLYFPKCQSEEDLPACKDPMRCNQDIDETENIIEFLSDRVLEEMGVSRQEAENDGKSKTYHLTEDEYQRMKAEGKIFANEPEHQEIIRSIYNENNRDDRGISSFRKEEL